MAAVIDRAFGNGCKIGQGCSECVLVRETLGGLVDTYAQLKSHLENVFDTRNVTLVFDEDAFYSSKDNTLHVPHTGKAEDAGDMVDGFIFESYNAIRRDQFIAGASSKESWDIAAHGTTTATIEAGTMTDFYKLATSMDEKDRTRNMHRCIKIAKGAGGSLAAHFMALPHVTDPKKLKALPPEDTRRLPTKVMYIYQNIENLGPLSAQQAVLTKLQLPFQVQKGRYRSTLELGASDSPKRPQAEKLLTVLAAKWPPTSKHKQRPYGLLQIINEVQTNADYDQLRVAMTEQAFGYDVDMKNMANLNKGGFTLV